MANAPSAPRSEPPPPPSGPNASPPPWRAAGPLSAALLRGHAAYFGAHLLVALAGLVSMPILTRLLSKADYGLLGLVLTAVPIAAMLAGLGLGDATVRLYPEARARGDGQARRLCESLFGGGLALGLAAGALALLAAGAAGRGPELARCLSIGAALVAVRIASSVPFQIQRAQERAWANAATQVAIRWLTTAAALALLLAGPRRPSSVLLATLIVEVLVALIAVADLWRAGVLVRPRLAREPLAGAVRYGAPLAVAAAAGVLLAYGDRFVIERLLGLDAVATYSVACDTARRLAETLLAPVQLAVVPVLFRLWATEGAATTARFASRVLTAMAAVALPAATLYLAISHEVIVLLGSAKYGDASELTPYLLPGVVLSTFQFVAAAGLALAKRTAILAALASLAAALEIGLDLALVPHYGLPAAAVSGSLAQVFLLTSAWYASRTTLPLRPDPTPLRAAWRWLRRAG